MMRRLARFIWKVMIRGTRLGIGTGRSAPSHSASLSCQVAVQPLCGPFGCGKFAKGWGGYGFWCARRIWSQPMLPWARTGLLWWLGGGGGGGGL